MRPFSALRLFTFLMVLSAATARAQSTSSVTFEQSSYIVNEAAGSITVNVLRSLPANSPVSVNYSTANGSALAGSDYTATSGTLTFAPNEFVKTITVPLLQDTVGEPDKMFYLRVDNPLYYYFQSSTAIVIKDDDGAPPVTTEFVPPPSAVVLENSGTVTLLLRRTGNLDLSSYVSYATRDGNDYTSQSARVGLDFTPQSGTVAFAPGEQTKTITLAIVDDTVAEPTEQFAVAFTPVTGFTNLNNSSTSISIIDDDAPTTVSFELRSYGVSESGGSMTARLLRTGNLSLTSTVFVATASDSAVSGLDFQSTASTIVFAPGETTKSVTVPIIDDGLSEGNESFGLTLSALSNASAADNVSVMIVDDEPLTIVEFPSPTVTVDEAAGTASITVTRRGLTNVSSSVDYATILNPPCCLYSGAQATATPNVDFRNAAGTLTFAPGETTKTITIDIIRDAISEGSEVFYVTLTSPTNAFLGASTVAAVTISDAAPAATSVTFSPSTYDVVEGGTVVVNVVRTGRLDVAASYYFSVNGAPTVTPTSEIVTFEPNQTTASITLWTADDLQSTGTRTYALSLSTPPVGFYGVTLSTGSLRVLDNEAVPSISISDADVQEGNAGQSSATFIVSLSAPSARSFSIKYEIAANGTSANDLTYCCQSSYLSFNAGETRKTVSVSLQPNTRPQGDRQFFVRLTGYSETCAATPPDANSCGLPIIVKGVGVGTIHDDDPGVFVDDTTVSEGNSGAAQAIFKVRLNFAQTTPVTVNYETANGSAIAGSDYVSAIGTLTFAPGETEKQVAVTVNGDTESEPDERFVLRLSNATGAQIARGDGVGIIVNDDLPYTLTSDLEYANVGGQSLTLDLYVPANSESSVPLILWIHGDHWSEGNKYASPAVRETSRGYAVASVEFRSSADAYFPAQINDIKAAVRWLRANAARFNLDTARFGAWGFGSGGHLAALLGTSGDVDKLDDPKLGNPSISSRVIATVDQAGPIDLMGMQDDALACSTTNHNSSGSYESLMLGCNLQYCYEKARSADPTAWITTDDGAFLLLYGDSDCEVGPGQGMNFFRALHNARIDATLSIGRGVTHVGQWWDSNDVRSQIDTFFDAKLKNASIPHRHTAQH